MTTVGKINRVVFKGHDSGVIQQANTVQNPQKSMELGNITPDFAVKTPVKYTKLADYELSSGLTMHSYKLSNGYKVSIVPMEGSPSVAKTYVNVGSMNETDNIKGISHFLEHMAFNGTNGKDGYIKLRTGDSFKKIDEIGGWTNASTNYAVTDYVNSAPLLEDKDLETQIKVLAAMTEDLELSNDMIKKEKGPVSSEINMILDNPSTIAIDQTVRTLFNVRSSADELVGGSVNHIQNLTRQDVLDYYNKYYTPDNINIVVTGDVNPQEVIELISKNFVSKKLPQGKKYEEQLTPIKETVRKDFLSDKTLSSTIVIGFAGPQNNDTRENIINSIVMNYLDSEAVGLNRNLLKYNSSASIDSEKISTNPIAKKFIGLYADSSEENTEEVLNTIFSTINNIKPISEKELSRIKDKLHEQRDELYEYSEGVNHLIGNAMLSDNFETLTDYDKILNSITAEDINHAITKYYDLSKAAITVVHPDNETVSFKGHSHRIPLDMNKISNTTLDNNYELSFVDTNSNRLVYNLSLVADTPYKQEKPGVLDLLEEILSMGTENYTEDEFNKYLEENNIHLYAGASADGIYIYMDGNNKNYDKALNTVKEILYNPRIDEETLDTAKNRLRDSLLRQEDSASSLYYDYKATIFPERCVTKDDILENLDNITVDDIKNCHRYLLENSKGTVAANITAKESGNIKSAVLNMASNLAPVLPNEIKILNIYKPQNETIVLTKDKNTAQADIKEVFRYKRENSIKENVAGKLATSILSNSSIGLFDILREKEHLAYSVYANKASDGNMGEISLNILTTTDNKETGEQSFDNLQKSINGFNRQIDALINGDFTDTDLENAKRQFKAQLLDIEGTERKVSVIHDNMNSIHGLDADNKIYKGIDNITKDDIIEFAKKAFSGNPVYSIVATQDTIDANKEFLEGLKD